MTCCCEPSPRTRRTISRGSCSPTVFSESGTHADQTRAEFIRSQCAGAHENARAVFVAHAWRWAGLCAPPDGWASDAEPALARFERGFVTRLQLPPAGFPSVAVLRRLFAAEPVAEVQFNLDNARAGCAVWARTLLPFTRPVTVTVARTRWSELGHQDAFLAALLSAPVMASASDVGLGGLAPGHTRTPLVNWLAKSPFLGRLRALNLARNRVGDVEACEFAGGARFARLTSLSLAQNHIGDVGALALARSPHLRNVIRLDVTENRFTEAGRDALLARFGSGVVLGA